MAEQQPKENWVFVVSTAGEKFVGRITEVSDDDAAAAWAVLNPCFDHHNEYQYAQGANGSVALVGQMNALTPHLGFVHFHDVQVYISSIVAVESLHESEQKMVMDMITAASARVHAERMHRESGLVVTRNIPKELTNASRLP